MKIRTGNLQTRLLLSICGLLTLVIMVEQFVVGQATVVGEPGAAALELQKLETPPYIHSHIEDFAEVLERPVFFAERQIPPESESPPAAPAAPIRLKLEGVAIVGEFRIAVLRDIADNKLLQLEQGMSHNGWTLKSVDRTSATFSRGTRLAEFSLDPPAGERRE